MSMIRVENLTFAYPGSYDNIFENVSFQLDTDWKLGLIGRNGRGKTTLLSLLRGLYAYRGSIQTTADFDYFPCPVERPERPVMEVLREVCPQAEDWEMQRELSLLSVREEVLERPFATLSGGEQTKVLLAALFLKEDSVPLIDEPTNHLDVRARATVAAYLKRKRGFILVSHDRSFLDGCVDHILALERTRIEIRRGNFSDWFAQFECRQEAELAQNERLKQSIRSMQRSARRTSDWAGRIERSKTGGGPVDRGYIGHQSARMMKRAKAIEGRWQQAIEERAGLLRDVENTEALKLSAIPYFARTLATFTDVAPIYGGREICAPLTFVLQQGERLVLDGANGSGKSSLLKLLRGQPIPHRGTVTLGSGVTVSYVPQETGGLRGLLSDFAAAQQLDESLFKAILHKMGFTRIQFEKNMEDFSAGQKKKVLLARSLCESAHLYVWDEPLNYIDLYSRMQIEQLILDFAPTMLLVEHDQAFRNAVATRSLRVAPGLEPEG